MLFWVFIVLELLLQKLKKMDLLHTFKVSKNVLLEEVGNDFILLHIDTGKFFRVNKTGKQIFLLIKKKYSLNGIYQHYKTQKKSAYKKDIRNFIKELLKRGFIEICH